MKFKNAHLILLLVLCARLASAQQHFKKGTGFVLEYGNIPAWAAIVDLAPKKVYVFDDNIYKGHSNFVLRYLKRKVTFGTFKELVKYPDKRQYIPFNLYDLRKKDFVFEGQKYSWAIKMCDYRLTDNPTQMISLLVSTYKYADEFLHKEDSTCGKGIILLSNSEEATPNIASLEGVQKAGLPVCALKQFYQLINFNPNTTHVLNEAKAYGIIHYVPAGEENNVTNNRRAIYVFEKTPERVPMAAGFITLQAQTFLSHINLLAINRKSPNASTNDKELIDQLKKLNKTEVEYITNKITNEISIKKAEIDFKGPNDNHPLKKTELVKADTSIHKIIFLNDSLHNALSFVGAKASNYALLQKNFPTYVKPGAAIPFSYYTKIIGQKVIAEKINEYCALPDSALVQRTEMQAQIRKLILNSQLPISLLNEIKEIQNKFYPGKKIRIRSSTNCEDLPEFNGAGLYTSKGIKPDETQLEIRKKLLQVYAAFWNDNACSERRFFGIDVKDAAMAILINEAYENEWANGVALSLPSDTGKTQLVIDAQPGEHEVTNPTGGDVPEELLYKNIDDSKFIVSSRSNYGKVFIANVNPQKALEELRVLTIKTDELLKQKLSAEERKKFGTDIEFKVLLRDGKYRLFIKQARLLNLY